MASTSLPSATSLVDFLSSKGKDSSFSARRSAYISAGLDKTLGDYSGSADQNTALLKNLSTTPASSTSEPTKSQGAFSNTPSPLAANAKTLFDPFISLAKGLQVAPPTTPMTVAPAKPAPATPTVPTTISEAPPAPNFTTLDGKEVYVPPVKPNQSYAPAPAPAPAPNPAPAPSPKAPAPTAPQAQGDNYTTPSGAVVNAKTGELVTPPPAGADTSTDSQYALSQQGFDISNTPQSESDLINRWLNSAEGQLAADRLNLTQLTSTAKTEAAKAALDTKYAADVKQVSDNLASHGLYLSGMRGSQIAALAESLAASKLDSDRELAGTLLDADLDFREKVLSGVSDLIKKADDGEKQAIQQLNAIGYAVINGQLVPTLAARSADRADAAAERADKQLAISEQRLALAEAADARSEARFQQLYGQGKSDQYSYARNLIALNPNASRAELLSGIMENTNLSQTEASNILDEQPLSQAGYVSSAQALVGNYFSSGLFGNNLDDAKKKAKSLIDLSGGVIKVGDRTIALNQEQTDQLKQYIDTVTTDEAKNAAGLVKK